MTARSWFLQHLKQNNYPVGKILQNLLELLSGIPCLFPLVPSGEACCSNQYYKKQAIESVFETFERLFGPFASGVCFTVWVLSGNYPGNVCTKWIPFFIVNHFEWSLLHVQPIYFNEFRHFRDYFIHPHKHDQFDTKVTTAMFFYYPEQQPHWRAVISLLGTIFRSRWL